MKTPIFLISLGILIQPNHSLAVINGKSTIDPKFASVGSLKFGNENSVGCTATLVSESWIVTAAHCISDGDSEGEEVGEALSPADYEFRLGVDFFKPVFKVSLKRWVPGPKVKGEDLDIAFGELSKPVPLQQLKISLIPILSPKWTTEDLKSSYIHIGYGVQEPFTERGILNNKRQMARFSVTSIKGNSLLNLFGTQQKLEAYLNRFHPQSQDAGPVEATLFNGELIEGYSIHAWDPRGRNDLSKINIPADGWQGTCFGDSGGPLFQERSGQIFLVGVVSHGMDRICSPFGTKFTTFGPRVMKLFQNLKSGKSPGSFFSFPPFFRRFTVPDRK